MNYKKILTIFKHEIFYILRDKSTLIVMVLLPFLIYPLLSVVSAYMLMESYSVIQKSVTKIAVSAKNDEIEKAVVEYYNGRKMSCTIEVSVLSTSEVYSRINSNKISAYISIPDDFNAKLAAFETTSVSIKYDLSNEKSKMAINDIENALYSYKEKSLKSSLVKLNVNPNAATGFLIKSQNIATPKQMGNSLLAQILPAIIIMLATISAFYPAIDVTAMEKQRGTIETLLLAPVKSIEIMFGKFLAVFSIAVFSILLNLLSMGITATHGFALIKNMASSPKMLSFMNISISVYSIFVIFIFLIPAACIMTAIMMQIAIFARNFKEAQDYSTPVLLFFMLPPLVSILPGYELTFKLSFVPVINLALLFKGMLSGNYVFSHAVITFVVNLFLSVVVIYTAARVFASENVMFRASEDITSLFFWRYKSLKLNQETALLTLFFFFQLLFFYFAGSYLQFILPFTLGIMASEIIVILAPSLIFAQALYNNALKYIEFKMPTFRQLSYSSLVGVSGFCFTIVITLLIGIVFRPPDDYMQELQKYIIAKNGMEFFVISVVTALLPAVCEETMFRGVILPVLYKKYGKMAGVLFCGALFGMFHFSIYRFIPTAVIGVYLSLLKIHTGSIIPSMLCHFINNFVIVASTNLTAGINLSSAPSAGSQTLLAAMSLAVFAFFILFPFIVWPMVKSEKNK